MRSSYSSDLRPLGDVVAIAQYKNDILVMRRAIAPAGGTTGAQRADISMFSTRSRMRLAFVAHNADQEFRSMLTLTYPAEFPTDGKLVKAHLNRFLGWIRRKYVDPGYLWFLEFQARGAPHIHILLTEELKH